MSVTPVCAFERCASPDECSWRCVEIAVEVSCRLDAARIARGVGLDAGADGLERVALRHLGVGIESAELIRRAS